MAKICSRFLVLFFLIFLLVVVNASAFQVSPAAKRMTNGTYMLRLINDQSLPLAVTLKAPAPVIVTPSELILPSGTKQVVVSVTNENMTPGLHRLPITIRAVPNGTHQFSGAITLIHTLTVLKLYAGSYLDAHFTASPSADAVRLILSFENVGKRATTASAIITVGNASWSGSTPVPAGGKGKLVFSWQPPAPGVYNASVKLSYADGTRTVLRHFVTRFAAGKPQFCFDLPNSTFVAGRIAGISLPAFLQWNEQVNASVTLTLSRDGKSLVSFTTPLQTFRPGQNAVRAFLDVPQVAGNATLTVSSPFGKKTWRVIITPAPTPAIISVARRAGRKAALPLAILVLLLVLTAFLLKRRRA